MIIIYLCLLCITTLAQATIPEANQHLLPSPFPVYLINGKIINYHYLGATEKMIPTDNTYHESPGCYIACYSRQPGIFSVSADIYLMGQIRVKGVYEERICRPKGFEKVDLSKLHAFKDLCAQKIASCKTSACWAGGDTGGWFGIP